MSIAGPIFGNSGPIAHGGTLVTIGSELSEACSLPFAVLLVYFKSPADTLTHYNSDYNYAAITTRPHTRLANKAETAASPTFLIATKPDADDDFLPL